MNAWNIGLRDNLAASPPDEPLCRTEAEIAADLLALRDFRLQMVGDSMEFAERLSAAYERDQSLRDFMRQAAEDYLSELVAKSWDCNPMETICETWGVNCYE